MSNNYIPGSTFADLFKVTMGIQGGTVSTAKFTKGDKVSIEATVKRYNENWGELEVEIAGETFGFLSSAAISEAKVVVTKKATPPKPAGGSVVRYWDVPYTIDDKGNLWAIGRDGKTSNAWMHWDFLTHSAVKVV